MCLRQKNNAVGGVSVRRSSTSGVLGRTGSASAAEHHLALILSPYPFPPLPLLHPHSCTRRPGGMRAGPGGASAGQLVCVTASGAAEAAEAETTTTTTTATTEGTCTYACTCPTWAGGDGSGSHGHSGEVISQVRYAMGWLLQPNRVKHLTQHTIGSMF